MEPGRVKDDVLPVNKPTGNVGEYWNEEGLFNDEDREDEDKTDGKISEKESPFDKLDATKSENRPKPGKPPFFATHSICHKIHIRSAVLGQCDYGFYTVDFVHYLAIFFKRTIVLISANEATSGTSYD